MRKPAASVMPTCTLDSMAFNAFSWSSPSFASPGCSSLNPSSSERRPRANHKKNLTLWKS